MRFLDQTRTDLENFNRDMDRAHYEQGKKFYRSRFYKWKENRDERRRRRKDQKRKAEEKD